MHLESGIRHTLRHVLLLAATRTVSSKYETPSTAYNIHHAYARLTRDIISQPTLYTTLGRIVEDGHLVKRKDKTYALTASGVKLLSLIHIATVT